jgi:hypothetical protein
METPTSLNLKKKSLSVQSGSTFYFNDKEGAVLLINTG